MKKGTALILIVFFLSAATMWICESGAGLQILDMVENIIDSILLFILCILVILSIIRAIFIILEKKRGLLGSEARQHGFFGGLIGNWGPIGTLVLESTTTYALFYTGINISIIILTGRFKQAFPEISSEGLTIVVIMMFILIGLAGNLLYNLLRAVATSPLISGDIALLKKE